MPLSEHARFKRNSLAPTPDVVRQVLEQHRDSLNSSGWVYCGYAPRPEVTSLRDPAADIDARVDNGFRLFHTCGFERTPVVVTSGFRSSRFAAVLFWEVLHALSPGGLWIDVDAAELCQGSPLEAEDYLARQYFKACLQPQARHTIGGSLVQTCRKIQPTTLAAGVDDRGWTFGILTAGPSPRAARMASQILALDLPQVEVIFCGPRPSEAPRDERVRTIDLDAPEPRGWITRKKNLIAEVAQHENLCLLHDRYVITPEWASALQAYGPTFAFLTFPQVYYAAEGARFPQRYPDYQVLYQQKGLAASLSSHIYDGNNVFHPSYEDFSETAFCCGGLYIAKRSLWNQVQQNEALFHGEWEDISFGLECQRRGIPHRVNPLLVAESTAPHPLLLTRIHDMSVPDAPRRGDLHAGRAQMHAASRTPEVFKPVLRVDREEYYARVIDRFNAIPGLIGADRLSLAMTADCRGLSDFWRAVEQRAPRLPLATRDQIGELCFFLSDTVFKWPHCELLSWIRAHEDTSGLDPLSGFENAIGWGTGSLFQSAYRSIGHELTCVVDSNPARWGSPVAGVEVKAPSVLTSFDVHRTAIVVFSCFVSEIAAAARAFGAFEVFAAADLVERRRFRPLADVVGYFEEVERYYPTLFSTVGAGVHA